MDKTTGETAEKQPRKRHEFSEEQRQRMAEAARKRWQRWREENVGSKTPGQKAEEQLSAAPATRKHREFSEEHRQRMAEAARPRWEQCRKESIGCPPLPHRKRETPAIDRRRLPRSPEVRAKMSELASKRKWDLSVRYQMSCSHAGRVCSPEVRNNMAAAQRQRRARERAERGGAASGVSPLPQSQLSNELAREAAVIELSCLRQQVFGWMDAYQVQHGRKPSLPETAEINPDVYRAFVRYVGLREMLRGGSNVGGAGSAAGGRGSAGDGEPGPSGRP